MKISKIFGIGTLLSILFIGQINAQWIIQPSIGTEFALPRYGYVTDFRDWPFRSFTKIPDNPQLTLHPGLDITREVSTKWSLYTNFAIMRYDFPVLLTRVQETTKARGRFNNIRTVLGTRYAVHENIRLGFGISFDYSYDFRYHDEDGERLDTNREYYITRDLGMNFNGTYHIGSFAFGIQINMGLIPLYSSDRKQIMEDKRELEPLSSIIATVGYRFEW